MLYGISTIKVKYFLFKRTAGFEVDIIMSIEKLSALFSVQTGTLSFSQIWKNSRSGELLRSYSRTTKLRQVSLRISFCGRILLSTWCDTYLFVKESKKINQSGNLYDHNNSKFLGSNRRQNYGLQKKKKEDRTS